MKDHETTTVEAAAAFERMNTPAEDDAPTAWEMGRDDELYEMLSGHRPLFTFHTSSERPYARVSCNVCDWKVMGDDPREVFPLADNHMCGQGGG